MTPEELAAVSVPCPADVASALAPALIDHVRKVHATRGEVDQRVVRFVQAVSVLADAFVDAGANDHGLAGFDPAHSNHVLTTDEAATRLRCTASNVRHLARTGRLRPLRSDPYLFAPDEIDNYRRSRRQRRPLKGTR
ncbi:MAG: helix-turn-helix domain-containing protein [Acidimicrobiales bacterium]